MTALRLAGCLAHVPQAVEQESAPVSSAMARGERLPRAGQTVRHNPTRGLVSVFLNSLGGTGKPDHLADPTELLVAPADVIVADCCRRHLPVRSSPSQRFSVSTVTKMSARVDLDNAELDRPQPAVTDDVALVTGMKRVEVRRRNGSIENQSALGRVSEQEDVGELSVRDVLQVVGREDVAELDWGGPDLCLSVGFPG